MMPQLHRPRWLRADCSGRSTRKTGSISPVNNVAFTTTRNRNLGPVPRLSLVVIFVFSLLSSSALAQRDPVANFCRRFGHQTAVIDRKLYIDGGFINYAPLPNNPTNYTNTFLSYHDLDRITSDSMPQLYSNLSKNATIPSVNGGVLWADDVNKKFYLYGGEYYQTPPTDPALYSYDTLNNYWVTMDSMPQSISSVSYGAGVSISELGEGYYYGGWVSNASEPAWKGARMTTTGLIRYDMDQNRWTNITGPDGTGRAEGSMVYIPVSDGGMLVYFGGVQDTRNGTISGQPMNEIFIYDIAISRWYKQTATGDVPGMRARFCAGVTWAEDRSSYNIYLYGGLGMPNYTSGYDDVYILSMPSFTWIKMYPSDSTLNQYPHNSLSCNVIDGAQMLIIGGSFPNDDQTCDAPAQYGAHGLDMGEQNADKSPWFFYRPDITKYVVPDLISNVIGGNGQGTATKTAPADGFDEPDLKILMSRRYTAPVRKPTRDISPPAASQSPSLSNGAIAGIAVGGAVVVIAIVAGIWFCCRRRRRRDQEEKSTPGMSSVAPIHSVGGSVWSPGSSHHTPVSPIPYGTGASSFLTHEQPHAIIPRHPVEMPGHLHDSGASEIYHEHLAPHSAISGGGVSPSEAGLASPFPQGADPIKYGHEIWPSPIERMNTVHVNNASVYTGGGFGPQELSSDPNGNRGSTDDRRHETFYHA